MFLNEKNKEMLLSYFLPLIHFSCANSTVVALYSQFCFSGFPVTYGQQRLKDSTWKIPEINDC